MNQEQANLNKPILYFDMDGVITDFQSAVRKQSASTLQQYKDHPDDIPGLFAQMEPMDGAIEAIKILATKYDCRILSTAPWKNPSAWSDKVQWITERLDDVFHKKITLTHNKGALADGKSYLIDDRTKHGADKFGGRLIQFGSAAFPDWKSVVDYLM